MEKQLDLRAFWNISYGLYIVTCCCDKGMNGQISNTVFQVTDTPAKIVVSINKKELTHEYIMDSKKFGVSVLEENVPMKQIGLFGFKSGRDVDKLSQVNYKYSPSGCPMVTDYVLALFEANVVETVDVDSHTLFIGEVTYSELLKEGTPLTYDNYHKIKHGKSPEYSPVSKLSKQESLSPIAKKEVAEPKIIDADKKDIIQKGKSEMKKYVCDVCGYIYDPELGDPDGGIAPGTAFEDLPDDWVCPICGVGKDDFSLES